MQTILINTEKKADATFIINLVKKLGLSAKELSISEMLDWQLAQQIEKGMKTSSISRNEIMSALGK
ncbi:MAG: hypothetical protein EAZ53_12150 [Bacteroidetes bacterium]|nr:MAG: hypothetical protein EAZ53_12150 [Bacteroidota bacterium]